MGIRYGASALVINPYAHELVPIVYYRDKTRVQMFLINTDYSEYTSRVVVFVLDAINAISTIRSVLLICYAFIFEK